MGEKLTYTHSDLSEYQIKPMIFVGRYRIGDNRSCIDFRLMVKPNWVHRKFCNLL